MSAGVNALPEIRAVSVHLKFKADGSIRTVIVQLESESSETS